MTSRPSRVRLRAGEGRAPSLVVLGAPRSGTTALAAWLRDAGIGVGIKDSFYLMDHDAGLRGPTHIDTHGVEGYLDLFPSHHEPTIECTAGYVYQRRALQFYTTWELPPQFVLIAREPVQRLRSVHRYFAGNLGVLPRDMTFSEYVGALFNEAIRSPDRTVSDALNQGCYARHLKPWTDAFGKSNVHVVTFDELTTHPTQTMSRLLDLAGTTPRIDLDAYGYRRRNESYMPRSQFVSGLTALGRRWMPTGRFRGWCGEKLRSVHALRGTQPPSDPRSDAATVAELQAFYSGANLELSTEFDLAHDLWTER